ncbi:MAG TPA: hypothetical protein EYG51_19835 [Pseudomonadales bacterium]|nr:hypothetical protein [Pseudomonadales bacterium]
MSKLFFIPIALIAVVLGFYWLNTKLAVEQSADVLTDGVPAPTVEIGSLDAIAESGVSTEPNQLIETYSEPAETADNIKISSAPFISVDDYAYQRDNSEVIHVGEFEDADDFSYRPDDSEVIHVGEFEDVDDVDDFSYQRDDSEVINVGEPEGADEFSYQRDDSEAIHVGEFEDADSFPY